MHVYEGLSHADGLSVALSRSIFPAAPMADFHANLRETLSVTKALERAGIPDYTWVSTRLTARTADPVQALHLRISEKAPILHSEGITVDPDGRPIECGQTWFAGKRVTLTLGDL